MTLATCVKAFLLPGIAPHDYQSGAGPKSNAERDRGARAARRAQIDPPVGGRDSRLTETIKQRRPGERVWLKVNSLTSSKTQVPYEYYRVRSNPPPSRPPTRPSLLTYYTLCAENHRWWWRAFLAPATTGLYVFGYAAYYYGAHLQEEAFDALQAGLFFGYMLLVALGVALVAGAAGFLASLKFLAYIFAQIKFD